MTAPSTIIDIRNLSFSYGKKEVLKDISFSVHAGSVEVIGGHSGCGKSTLLKLIAGFETPTLGTIYLNGLLHSSPVYSIPPEKRNIGIVFQDFALFPKMTVEQNIRFGLSNINAKNTEMVIDTILSKVRLEGLKKRYPHQLSIGQMQRAALARALVMDPPLLLLDEPFSSLDNGTIFHLIDELQEILEGTNTAVLYVTHESLESLYLADNLMLISNGTIIQQGTPEQIYNNPCNHETAQYFDEVNFLPVTKSVCNQLTTPCGFIEESLVENYDEYKDKKAFHLCVRPHMLEIKTNRHIRYQQANWTVIKKHFMGNHYKIVLQSKHPLFSGVRIIITQKLTTSWPHLGEIVQVMFVNQKVWALDSCTA